MTDNIPPGQIAGVGERVVRILNMTSLWNSNAEHDKVYHVISLEVPAPQDYKLTRDWRPFQLWGLYGRRGKSLALSLIAKDSERGSIDAEYVKVVNKKLGEGYLRFPTTDERLYPRDAFDACCAYLLRETGYRMDAYSRSLIVGARGTEVGAIVPKAVNYQRIEPAPAELEMQEAVRKAKQEIAQAMDESGEAFPPRETAAQLRAKAKKPAPTKPEPAKPEKHGRVGRELDTKVVAPEQSKRKQGDL